MSTLKTSNIQDTSGGNNSTPEEISQGRAKAWVNFDGTFATSPYTTANGGIRDSYNVDSITDNGTGLYVVNFSSGVLANANYSAVASVSWQAATSRNTVSINSNNSGVTAPSTSSMSIEVVNYSNGTAYNANYVHLVVFGD